MTTKSAKEWAGEVFGEVAIKDCRLKKRVQKMAANFAEHEGASVARSSPKQADVQGAYRCLSNQNVNPEEITKAGCLHTASLVEKEHIVLALEDTTHLCFNHKTIKEELGRVNKLENSRAMQAHTVMLYDCTDNKILGLAHQKISSRDPNVSRKNMKLPYEQRESYKWEESSKFMADIMPEKMPSIISVCDRESDIFEYLNYKISNNQRFVIRSSHNRKINDIDEFLHDITNLKKVGYKNVHVAQKGGRKSKIAKLKIDYARVDINSPKDVNMPSINLTYLRAQEVGTSKDRLCWHILTTEIIENKKDALMILEFYEHRWMIEEFHKAWKSGGTKIEDQRLQSKESMFCLATILAFVAVRILQLRELGEHEDSDERECTEVLTPIEWRMLWIKMVSKKLPDYVPSCSWAYKTLGTLGCWHDTKRTGRVGWVALWRGWHELTLLVDGYYLSKELDSAQI